MAAMTVQARTIERESGRHFATPRGRRLRPPDLQPPGEGADRSGVVHKLRRRQHQRNTQTYLRKTSTPWRFSDFYLRKPAQFHDIVPSYDS